MEPSLQWIQRLTLVRYQLHMISHTRDFSFFKALQAHFLIDAIDYSNLLAAIAQDEDNLIKHLDKCNSVICYVHEDAFKNVYECARYQISELSSSEKISRLRNIRAVQKAIADTAIDKMIESAMDLIQAQPLEQQDNAAHVLIIGTTFTVDAIAVCLSMMDKIEQMLDCPAQLDESLTLVQGSVGATVSAMKGIFGLADANELCLFQKQTRSQSVDTTAKNVLGRMINALHSSSSSNSLASLSIQPVVAVPQSRRQSMSSNSSYRSLHSSNSVSNPWIIQACNRPGTANAEALPTIPATPSMELSNPFASVVLKDSRHKSVDPSYEEAMIGPNHEISPTHKSFINTLPKVRAEAVAI